jgi:hypothetical protein
VVHGTFSPARAWRLAAAFGLTITLGSTGNSAAHHHLFAGVAAQTRAPDRQSRASAASASARRRIAPPPRTAARFCSGWVARRGTGRYQRCPSLTNLSPLRQPALRRRGTEVTCPKTLRIHLSVLPNPSLGTDPLRQASLPVRRAGLCCTTRASRPASAVGVSSNVRPHNRQQPENAKKRHDHTQKQVTRTDAHG